MAQTLVEKIAQKFAVGLPDGHEVHSGDYITISPAHIMTHDNTGAVIPKFKGIGANKLAIPNQVVHTLDHNVQDSSDKNLEKYKKIEEFSKSMGAHFFPAGRGIGHQIMCEEGFAFPGTMVVASDSHSNMYGGLGCLGTPIVRTDAAAIWATGKSWWQVPPVVKVILDGNLKPGVFGKDVIIALAGFFNKDEVLNCAIEFTGSGIESLSIDERLSIANMTTEWGALTGVFPIDKITLDWLKTREKLLNKNKTHQRINNETISALESNIPIADSNAFYIKEITLDLSSVVPSVSGPNTVKTLSSVTELEEKNISIQKAYLLSCVNGRFSDLKEAASVIKGKKVADGVKFYIGAASSEVQKSAEDSGDWKVLLDAGAIPLIPGCGPCIGLGVGLLEDGEVGISATNRNFKGRMGSPNASAYLASPAIVAASAVAGKIASPSTFEICNLTASIKTNKKVDSSTKSVEIIPGFPEIIEGEILFCNQDNLNTDGIYPGKYTYNDDFTPQQQAEVVMENYDPEFVKIANPGDILAGGYNFGTGSSREQAATALKYKGIAMVLAGSFNETYKRNAINNGYLVIECPALIDDLKSSYGNTSLTNKIGIKAKVDFVNSKLTFNNKEYSIDPVGKAAQELIMLGGLENWVKNSLNK